MSRLETRVSLSELNKIDIRSRRDVGFKGNVCIGKEKIGIEGKATAHRGGHATINTPERKRSHAGERAIPYIHSCSCSPVVQSSNRLESRSRTSPQFDSLGVRTSPRLLSLFAQQFWVRGLLEARDDILDIFGDLDKVFGSRVEARDSISDFGRDDDEHLGHTVWCLGG